jgi:hypothetical protein
MLEEHKDSNPGAIVYETGISLIFVEKVNDVQQEAELSSFLEQKCTNIAKCTDT